MLIRVICGESYSPITNQNLKIMSENNKITWPKVLQAIIQAAIAALTALGITSCTTML